MFQIAEIDESPRPLRRFKPPAEVDDQLRQRRHQRMNAVQFGGVIFGRPVEQFGSEAGDDRLRFVAQRLRPFLQLLVDIAAALRFLAAGLLGPYVKGKLAAIAGMPAVMRKRAQASPARRARRRKSRATSSPR